MNPDTASRGRGPGSWTRRRMPRHGCLQGPAPAEHIETPPRLRRRRLPILYPSPNKAPARQGAPPVRTRAARRAPRRTGRRSARRWCTRPSPSRPRLRGARADRALRRPRAEAILLSKEHPRHQALHLRAGFQSDSREACKVRRTPARSASARARDFATARPAWWVRRARIRTTWSTCWPHRRRADRRRTAEERRGTLCMEPDEGLKEEQKDA